MFILIVVKPHFESVAANGAALPPESGKAYHHVQTSDGEVDIYLHKRQAYPGTFCHRETSGDIVMGYGQPNAAGYDDEYFRVRLTSQGSLHIERDLFCVMPLFYGCVDGVFVASNDYAEVVTRLPKLSLDIATVADQLLGTTSNEQPTIWNEVHVLGERQQLAVKNGHVTLLQPPPRQWAYGSELVKTDPRAFPALLKERWERFIATRLSGQHIGFELSGGLDSAFLPLFMTAQGYHAPFPAGTVIQPHARDQQLRKIEALEAYTSLRSLRVFHRPETHYPLVHLLQGNRLKRPLHIIAEIYEPGMSEIANDLRQRGVSVVVTGGGGDQLLEHRPHPSRIPPEKKKPPEAPPFIIPPVGHDTMPDYFKLAAIVPTLLAPTIVHEHIAHANIYIERDMWPVSPFNDLILFNYLQALPIQFRANKNIFRAYFEASHYPEITYRGANEDFGDFFTACLLSDTYHELIRHYTGHSHLERFGLVDAAKLYETYQTMRGGGCDTDSLFQIYVWLTIELDIRAAKDR